MVVRVVVRAGEESLVEELSPDWTPHPPLEGMSIEALSRNHKRWTETWRKSAEHQEFVTFFNPVLENDSIEISTCVCLCMGTISEQSSTRVSSPQQALHSHSDS